MKTQNLLQLLQISLLIFSTLSAYAFYDPGVQRWLNRDPIMERSGINLFRFVGNEPNGKFDPFGLFHGLPDPGIPFPRGTRTETAWECGWRVYHEVGKVSPFEGFDDSTRWNHCVASCRVSRECPGGRLTAWLGSDVYEDPFWAKGKSDPKDRIANRIGRELSCKRNRSCEALCDEAFLNGDIPGNG